MTKREFDEIVDRAVDEFLDIMNDAIEHRYEYMLEMIEEQNIMTLDKNNILKKKDIEKIKSVITNELVLLYKLGDDVIIKDVDADKVYKYSDGELKELMRVSEDEKESIIYTLYDEEKKNLVIFNGGITYYYKGSDDTFNFNAIDYKFLGYTAGYNSVEGIYECYSDFFYIKKVKGEFLFEYMRLFSDYCCEIYKLE